MKTQYFIAALMLLMITFSNAQNKAVFTVNTDKPVADVQPTMWGIFFEDINLGADGGIYAELIKNRSFEFFKPLMGWKVMRVSAQKDVYTEGDITVLNRPDKTSTNPRFMRISLNNHLKGNLGLQNEGFRGMGIKKDLRYDFSVLYRQKTGNIKIHLELLSEKGEVIGVTIMNASQRNQQ